VEQYISSLTHVGDPLPKTWANVRSVLENQALGSDNYIDIREYRQICESQGITKRTEQERLSHFLHNLGVFLHFQAIPQLSKTIFLTPQWSTDAVYKVLDTPKVRKDCGRFANEDLNEIWKDNQYKDVQSELLALMKKFEVCYEITGRDDHYIAPHLLEANLSAELDYRETWDSTDNLIVTYHYPFKPKNIFPRFIVSLHPYIEKQRLVWKHGVVLNTSTARAEIIEDDYYNAANINIRISGTDKKRLLSIIGHELERIHTSFKNLKYETLIPCNCAECSECKSDKKPYQFAYKVLQNSLAKHNLEVQCQKSFDMVNVRRLIDDVIEPQTYLDRTYTDPDPSIARSQSIRSANPQTSSQSPFSNKLDITVNFPEQKYEESSNINIGGNVTDSNIIRGDKNTIDTSSKNTYKYGDTYNQSGPGDNIGGDKVLNDKINNQINNNTDLTTAARDIKALLSELSEEYNPNTPKGQTKIKNEALTHIQQTPQLKQRTLAALKSAGSEALEQAIQHPIAKVVIEGVKGFLDA
ncbi:MAG: COR domain-containing protein, partial [Phormidesmis sp.]